jgi:GT2 family glycosyltransferase
MNPMKVHIESTVEQAPAGERVLPRVSIVIVVWNAKNYVWECLESLREHCQSTYDEVIVVDNCSLDGTAEMIARLFPEFRLIRNPENYGFAKANNIGISISSGELICLVNSDVKFTNDCISLIRDYMVSEPQVAMVGPKMLGPDGSVRRSTMRLPDVWSYFCHAVGLDSIFKGSRLFGAWLMSDFDHRRTLPVEVLNGWFLVVRRQAVQRVGLLDTEFFMYGEDVEWCHRFKKAGEQLVFFADAEAIHYGGASSSSAPVQFHLEKCRANWRYWRKHHGWLGQVGFLSVFAIHHGLRLISSSCAYLCLPHFRSQSAVKVKRNLSSLKWIGTAALTH